MSSLTRERKINTVERFVSEAQDLRLVMNRAATGNGADCVVDGVTLKNFGSCSYMGLEKHPALLAGARTALEQYGTQFSFSRAYLESPLYAELEHELDFMTGRHTLVAPSTTLAHLAALPILVGVHDVVLIDQFAHASLHMATDMLKENVVQRVRHNRMDMLERKLLTHAGTAERIWYICDGVYSMLGDFAEFAALADLLERYPQLHIYVDDAHAVSWTGASGRGAALSHLGHSERVIVALSLNKAFAAAGAVLALPTAAMRTRIRRCGGPMLFSGPVQPPMLGAALASAKLHVDPAFAALQAELDERICFAEAAIQRHGLRVANLAHTPIFMVQFESPGALHRVLRAIRDLGYYCCLSTFPAVPMDKPSLRFTVSRHNSFEDIGAFIERLAMVVKADAPAVNFGSPMHANP